MALDQKIKRRVRAELFRCAIQGQFLTYEQFYDRLNQGKNIGKMGSFPYHPHFNEIAEEERGAHYPDITFLVYSAVSGYPLQIEFRPADPPNALQLASLRAGAADLIAMYCPGATHPY